MIDNTQVLISTALPLRIDLFFWFAAVPTLPQGMFDCLESVLDNLLTGMNTIQSNHDPDGNRNRNRVSDYNYKH